MCSSCQSIPMTTVAFTDDWNLHPWELNDISEDLQKSFSLTGILHPPIVLQNGSGDKYTIVHGFKRLLWAKNHISTEHIDCLTITKDAPPTFILDIILTDHLTNSTISLAEKARFTQIAARFVNNNIIENNYLPLLGLKKKNNAITEILKILEQDEKIIKEIHAGRIQDKMVSEIMKLRNSQDRLALADLFQSLCLGDGKQKRLFSLIRDIAFRENLSIAGLLEKSELQDILNHEEMNNPQKAQHLANILQRDLTPDYHDAQDKFNNEVKNLQLPKNCSISHVPAFEKDEITLSVTFKDFVECKQLLPKIKNVFKTKP